MSFLSINSTDPVLHTESLSKEANIVYRVFIIAFSLII